MEIEGTLFNRIEEINNQKVQHIGFEPNHGDFGSILEQLVPNIGDKLKVKLSITIEDENNE